MTMEPVTRDNYFDAAQALYWYANDYHEGQWSELYSILSTLEYRPGLMESEPDESAQPFYDALVSGEIDAVSLRNAIALVMDETEEG
jgi:hypothetical protein